MKFIPDGPDIPNNVIRNWRDGKVLFLAGAGVSAASKLPLFDGLGLEVYKSLGDSLSAVIPEGIRRKTQAGRRAILDGALLSPKQIVEATLFFDRQFDRFFSALEKRLDPDLAGRPKTRNVRNAVEKILSGKKFSQNHSDLLRLSMAEGASTRPLCRLVTTNFDLLFEDAWKSEFGSEAVSFDARIAPRPGAHNFEGIIHLHGVLQRDPASPADFVLSSRDFARVYLRSGVIGNYIYDLMRRYTVVLLGYSADDPPMRYLMDAIGEDASLFDDMNPPHAITNLLSKADLAVEEEVWRAKEIEATFYSLRAGVSPHAPLWETIAAWAEWAKEGQSWVERRFEEVTKSKYVDATPFDKAFVQDLFSLLTMDERESVARHLAKLKLDFGWVTVLALA
jgi:NAD-dependent SIR2 family protein deacetylase